MQRLEVVDVGRRWTESEKLRIVHEGLSGPRLTAATACQHGVSRQLLLNWRKAWREGRLGGEAAAGFVPAIVTGEPQAACRADTLTWRPSSGYEPSVSTVVLLDQHGKSLSCRLSSFPAEPGTARYQIEDALDRPAFAQVQHGGKTSVPAIVTLIDRLRATTRETSSRQADKALRDLDRDACSSAET